MKKGIVFIEIIVILAVMGFVLQFRDRYYQNKIQDELEAIAMEISESIYNGDVEYFAALASHTAYDEIMLTIEIVQGRFFEVSSIDEYSDEMDEKNRVVVINRIEEEPFQRVVFHKMVFIPSDNSWLISEFEMSFQ
jgi:hypothetical protein